MPGAGGLSEGQANSAPYPTDFDPPALDEVNDPADDVDYDAAFQKHPDTSGATGALEDLISQLESIGIMSLEDIANAVESLPLPQRQESSASQEPRAISIKQALEVVRHIFVFIYEFVFM